MSVRVFCSSNVRASSALMWASALITAGAERMEWNAWSTSCASAAAARPMPPTAAIHRETAFISLASIAQVAKEANIRVEQQGGENDPLRNVAGGGVEHGGGSCGGGNAARARQVPGGRDPHLRELPHAAGAGRRARYGAAARGRPAELGNVGVQGQGREHHARPGDRHRRLERQ